jgi:hypothetical protein
MYSTLSFEARSAVAAFKIHKSVDLLRKSLQNADYDAHNERGETLLDIADRLGQRRAIGALEQLCAKRTH